MVFDNYFDWEGSFYFIFFSFLFSIFFILLTFSFLYLLLFLSSLYFFATVSVIALPAPSFFLKIYHLMLSHCIIAIHLNSFHFIFSSLTPHKFFSAFLHLFHTNPVLIPHSLLYTFLIFFFTPSF